MKRKYIFHFEKMRPVRKTQRHRPRVKAAAAIELPIDEGVDLKKTLGKNGRLSAEMS